MVKITLRNPIALILFAYLVVTFLHLACGTFLGFERLREQRGFALQHVLRMSKPLLKDGRVHELAKYLGDAQSTGLVDYYQLIGKGRNDSAGVAPALRPSSPDPVLEQDGWTWGRQDAGELSLRLASGYGYAFRFRAAMEAEAERAPIDLVFVILACAVALGFTTPRPAFAPRRESRLAKVARQEAPKKSIDAGDFTGVCGRAALFNQAELAAGSDPAAFFSSLDEFFADASAVLARYRGRLLGAHGHEILFYFAEKNPALDCRLAAAAVRDLADLAARRGFRFGSVLAHGRLHGAQLISGFALLGTPVEETAELLLRREDGLFVTDSFAAQIGLTGTSKKGVRALPAAPLFGDALVSARTGDVGSLTFHRGDESLTELLRSLASGSWEKEAYVSAVGELRQVQCRRCGPSVVDSYRALLAGELARKDSYRLSSAVALAATLLSRSQIDRALEKLFLQAASVKDRRVRANAVELFTKFFPEREIPELRPLIRDEDNRVSANALIKAACERFDEKVISRIDDRIRGGSVAHVASALHAMGEIALYYRRHDPLFLGSKISFLRLFDGVSALASHPNSMIRRQALIAAHKLASEPVDARLRELFANCNDPELLSLFGTVYGWRKDTERAAA
jgi:hypothetical protein